MIMIIVVFFFKQKTAYVMRISDWSLDVCSSDLGASRGNFASGQNLRKAAFMRFTSALKTVAIGFALYASSGAALAQGGGGRNAEEMKKEVAAVRAEQTAKQLGLDPASRLPAATVPVDPQNVWDLDLSSGGRVRIQLRPDIAQIGRAHV